MFFHYAPMTNFLFLDRMSNDFCTIFRKTQIKSYLSYGITEENF